MNTYQARNGLRRIGLPENFATQPDIRVIQVLLGHSKLETTALYSQVATRTLRETKCPLDALIFDPLA